MSHSFEILSLATDDKHPVGVDPATPPSASASAPQVCYLNAPIQIWTLDKIDDRTYHLSIAGYPYTGVIDDTVTASNDPADDRKWRVTYRANHDAYTIELADGDGYGGWTVDNLPGDLTVKIQTMVSTRSLPPQFLASQLFELVGVDDWD